MATTSPDGTPSVLFVCIHNAGRSQMAAGWLAALAGDAIEVRSAGTAPADQVNPAAVEAMREVGIDITSATRRCSPVRPCSSRWRKASTAPRTTRSGRDPSWRFSVS